ncbi:hypothetical protein V7S43_018602 [Phytophthora oleae]|uniref:Pol protein n=1 Tax=Phytophthora oleae TaxID=2107226 RepID=A0ABD3EQ12_9STRA
MTTHPTFYVGRLKRYHDPQGQAAPQEEEGGREVESATPRSEVEPQAQGVPQGQESSDSQEQSLTPVAGTSGVNTPRGRTSDPQRASRSTAGSTHTAAAPDGTPTPSVNFVRRSTTVYTTMEILHLLMQVINLAQGAWAAGLSGGPTAIPKAKSNNLVKRPSRGLRASDVEDDSKE